MRVGDIWLSQRDIGASALVSADVDSLFNRAFRGSKSMYIVTRYSCQNTVNGGVNSLTAASRRTRVISEMA